MQHNKQYVSNALKMYNAIQPYVPPVITEPDIVDVEFRELPSIAEIARMEVRHWFNFTT